MGRRNPRGRLTRGRERRDEDGYDKMNTGVKGSRSQKELDE